MACQCLGILGPGGVPVFSPPAIASLALQAVVVSQPTLPPIIPCTTFASISNVTATVYTAEVGIDDLSTRALEDALLPPLPPSQPSHPLSHPLALSYSATSPHTNVIHASNGNTYWGAGKSSDDNFVSMEKSDTAQSYGDEVNMTDIKEENFGNLNVKMEKIVSGMQSIPSHTEYDRFEESRGAGDMVVKENATSSNSDREKEREISLERERDSDREVDREDERDGEKEKEKENERERERERERETDLNMNGEPVSITESECVTSEINQPMDEE